MDAVPEVGNGYVPATEYTGRHESVDFTDHLESPFADGGRIQESPHRAEGGRHRKAAFIQIPAVAEPTDTKVAGADPAATSPTSASPAAPAADAGPPAGRFATGPAPAPSTDLTSPDLFGQGRVEQPPAQQWPPARQPAEPYGASPPASAGPTGDGFTGAPVTNAGISRESGTGTFDYDPAATTATGFDTPPVTTDHTGGTAAGHAAAPVVGDAAEPGVIHGTVLDRGTAPERVGVPDSGTASDRETSWDYGPVPSREGVPDQGTAADHEARDMIDVAAVFDDQPAPESRQHTFGMESAPPAYDHEPVGSAAGAEPVPTAREQEPAPTAFGAASAGAGDADSDGLPQVRITGPAGETGSGGRARPSKAMKIGIAAAALVVLVGGTAGAITLTGGGGDADEGQVLAAPRQADPALSAEQRKAAETQRRQALRDEAARAGRNAFSDRPDLSVKSKPKPTPTAEPGGGAGVGPIGPVLAGSPREIARKMLPKYGWSPSAEFGCLDRLWQKESSWNPRAANPSGAYGIPQALPGSKMASAGSDWETNPATQIEWGLDYIKGRYSSPCAAWSHSETAGWY